MQLVSKPTVTCPERQRAREIVEEEDDSFRVGTISHLFQPSADRMCGRDVRTIEDEKSNWTIKLTYASKEGT